MVRIGIDFLIIMLIITLVSIPIGAEEITDASNKSSVSADNALVVKKISFRGTDEESEVFLRTFIQTKVGAEISPDLLSKDLKSLYKGTGFLSEIAVDVQPAETDGLEVIYRLKESPKVESIKIIGTEKLKYGKVKEGIVLKAGETYSDKRRWESERNILEIYKEKGYYLAGVKTHSDIDPDTNTATVTFEVSEGQRVKIQEINFIGNENITPKVLAKQIKTRVDKHFDEGLFDEDLTALRYYYQDKGFSQVKIQGYEKRFTDDKTALMLDVTVDEGPQFIIASYEIKIQSSEKSVFSEKKIRKMLDSVEGEIFNRGAFQKSVDKIFQAYQDKGYLLATVVPIPKYNEVDGVVDLTLNINEGNVLIIGKVQINGLEKTKENVVRRELNQLKIKEGEFLDTQALRKARQRLFQMGSFIRDVDFVPSESQEERRDLTVNIAETSRTGLFSLGGGFGTEGGIFGVAEVGENNLFGRAYRLHLKMELGSRDRHTAELRFNTPWIFGTPTRLGVNLYNTKRQRRYYGQLFRDQGYDRYVYEQRGGSVTLGRPVLRNIDVSVRLKNEHVQVDRSNPLFSLGLQHQPDLENTTITPDLKEEFKNSTTSGLSENAKVEIKEEGTRWLISDLVGDTVSKYVIVENDDKLDIYQSGSEPFSRPTRSVTFFLTRDTRDYLRSIYDPMGGSLNTFSYEFSGGILGAKNSFQKYSMDSSWFVNSWFNHVFAAHAHGGYMKSKRSDDTFLFLERFLLGGIDTVRGYDDFEILPDSGNINGGNKVFYANFEYRIPLASQLTGAIFFDVGQVWDESQDNIFKDVSLRKGIGAGIRFDLMGMLARIEWGYGFDREINGIKEPRGKFHFTIGPGF